MLYNRIHKVSEVNIYVSLGPTEIILILVIIVVVFFVFKSRKKS